MIGDESNKDCNCHIVKLIQDVFPDVKAELVASKAGEESELPLCPFCGKYPQSRIIDGLEDTYFHCVLHTHLFKKEEWNNAWAHKRIAELEHALVGRTALLEAMGKQIAELENKIEQTRSERNGG